MRRAVLLLTCMMVGLSPGLPALAQQAAPQEADVVTLKKEVQELHQQLDEQQRAHEAEMKELRQKLAELSAAQSATTPAASGQEAEEQRLAQQAEIREIRRQLVEIYANQVRPGARPQPTKPTDELGAAIQEAQGEAAPADQPQVTNPPGNWLFGQQAAPLQSFNPDISLVGDFQAIHHSNQRDTLQDRLIVRELELGISGNIDPYLRFDSVFSVHPKTAPDTGYDISVEEAYVSTLTKPYGLDGKLGKFRVGFGKVNELHQHALPWPDYPLVIQKYFGDEGLEGEGASVSWLAPGDQYIEVTAQSFVKASDSLFGGDASQSFVQLVHMKTFFDLSRQATLELGGSAAVMPNSDTRGAHNGSVEGLDLTYKWRPEKEGLYKSFRWLNEVLASQRDAGGQTVNAWGLYSAPEYQFARQWAAGLRYDYVQNPDDSGQRTNGVGVYLTFLQSEFCYWRLGYEYSRSNFPTNGHDDDHAIMLQLDFTLGPHPAHKY